MEVLLFSSIIITIIPHNRGSPPPAPVVSGAAPWRAPGIVPGGDGGWRVYRGSSAAVWQTSCLDSIQQIQDSIGALLFEVVL